MKTNTQTSSEYVFCELYEVTGLCPSVGLHPYPYIKGSLETVFYYPYSLHQASRNPRNSMTWGKKRKQNLET